jgi:hypothetical protein
MNEQACWTSHPHEWQPLLDAWAQEQPERVTLHAWPQYGGEVVRGLTLAAPGATPEQVPFRLLVTVPHAHEPACTAACVDLASQLLTGRHRDGTAADVDGNRVLARAQVTLIPDTNAQGRARSPERYWDGSQGDNDRFLKVAFGIAADGERFGRYPEWRLSEHSPRQVGIVYEQLDADRYVEPNTHRESTHSRAIDALFARYRFTHHLDMHQHEGDEAVHLPADFDDQEPEAQARLRDWAGRLIAAWQAAGATPRPEPYVAYRGQPRQQFFRDYWQGRCPGTLRLVSEVRNNRHTRTGDPTPIAHQLRMCLAALTTTLELAAKS